MQDVQSSFSAFTWRGGLEHKSSLDQAELLSSGFSFTGTKLGPISSSTAFKSHIDWLGLPVWTPIPMPPSPRSKRAPSNQKKGSMKDWKGKFVFVSTSSGSTFREIAHSSFHRRVLPITRTRMIADVEKLCEGPLQAKVVGNPPGFGIDWVHFLAQEKGHAPGQHHSPLGHNDEAHALGRRRQELARAFRCSASYSTP
ncbi:unnamed protein product [Cuscuta campestris]|uniref:Uncharacterized protein n=1 Tax=Cuscuta campestris TaxID=132261 RepID=A0A484L3E9_9ASTE|nr:unnamed protein product [Cuscuta campestris]